MVRAIHEANGPDPSLSRRGRRATRVAAGRPAGAGRRRADSVAGGLGQPVHAGRRRGRVVAGQLRRVLSRHRGAQQSGDHAVDHADHGLRAVGVLHAAGAVSALSLRPHRCLCAGYGNAAAVRAGDPGMLCADPLRRPERHPVSAAGACRHRRLQHAVPDALGTGGRAVLGRHSTYPADPAVRAGAGAQRRDRGRAMSVRACSRHC